MIKSNEQKLDEFIIEQILSMNESELQEDFKASGLNLKMELEKFQKASDSASLPFRKQRFESIQARLKEGNIESPCSSEVINGLKERGQDIKDFVFKLLHQGDIPQEMTIAFRDGQEISDEELLDIIGDLIELGVVKDDKQTDSK